MQLARPQQTTNIWESIKERRKFTRLIPKDGTMAVNNCALGPVVDISMGGLSFRYAANTSAISMTNIFGIFLASDNILIDRIQSKIISNKELDPKTSFSQARSHQLAIQFINLSVNQQKKLEDFILTKTQGVA